MNFNVGMGLLLQLHIKYPWLVFWQPCRYFCTIWQQSVGFRQKQLVPESITAVFSAYEVISISPAQNPIRFRQYPWLFTTSLQRVQLSISFGITLQQTIDWLVIFFNCKENTLVFIWPALKARSRKLGILEYPMPTIPITGPPRTKLVTLEAKSIGAETLTFGNTETQSVP